MTKLIDRIFNRKKVKEQLKLSKEQLKLSKEQLKLSKEQLKLSDERTGEDFKLVMSKPEIYYILGWEE